MANVEDDGEREQIEDEVHRHEDDEVGLEPRRYEDGHQDENGLHEEDEAEAEGDLHTRSKHEVKISKQSSLNRVPSVDMPRESMLKRVHEHDKFSLK